MSDGIGRLESAGDRGRREAEASYQQQQRYPAQFRPGEPHQPGSGDRRSPGGYYYQHAPPPQWPGDSGMFQPGPSAPRPAPQQSHEGPREQARPRYSILNSADLWVLEHIAARYDLPDSLVEGFTQAILAPNPNADLPSWLAARVLLRVLSKQLADLRDSEQGGASAASAESVLESLTNLSNYISRDPSLPPRYREPLSPPGTLLADVKQFVAMMTMQRELGSESSSSRMDADPTRLAQAIVERVFFPGQTGVSQEEDMRGMKLVSQLQNAHGSPMEVLGGSGTVAGLKAQIIASVISYHESARASLGRTTLQFIQQDLDGCGLEPGPGYLRDAQHHSLQHGNAPQGAMQSPGDRRYENSRAMQQRSAPFHNEQQDTSQPGGRYYSQNPTHHAD